jgi:hypothetical protein
MKSVSALLGLVVALHLSRASDPGSGDGILIGRFPKPLRFHATVHVIHDSQPRQGRIVVGDGGRIFVEHLDPATASWLREQLASVLGLKSVETDMGSGWQAIRAPTNAITDVTWARLADVKVPAVVRCLGPGPLASWIIIYDHRVFRP